MDSSDDPVIGAVCIIGSLWGRLGWKQAGPGSYLMVGVY
jgi:hypothetical protein